MFEAYRTKCNRTFVKPGRLIWNLFSQKFFPHTHTWRKLEANWRTKINKSHLYLPTNDLCFRDQLNGQAKNRKKLILCKSVFERLLKLQIGDRGLMHLVMFDLLWIAWIGTEILINFVSITDTTSMKRTNDFWQWSTDLLSK